MIQTTEKTELNFMGFSLDVIFDLYRVVDTEITYTAPWYAKLQSPLFEILEKFLLDTTQFGLDIYYERIPKLYITYSKNMFSRQPSEPQVLTMTMLSAGFLIWLGCVVVSCVVFIGEHIYRYFSKSSRMARKREKIERLKLAEYLESITVESSSRRLQVVDVE